MITNRQSGMSLLTILIVGVFIAGLSTIVVQIFEKDFEKAIADRGIKQFDYIQGKMRRLFGVNGICSANFDGLDPSQSQTVNVVVRADEPTADPAPEHPVLRFNGTAFEWLPDVSATSGEVVEVMGGYRLVGINFGGAGLHTIDVTETPPEGEFTMRFTYESDDPPVGLPERISRKLEFLMSLTSDTPALIDGCRLKQGDGEVEDSYWSTTTDNQGIYFNDKNVVIGSAIEDSSLHVDGEKVIQVVGESPHISFSSSAYDGSDKSDLDISRNRGVRGSPAYNQAGDELGGINSYVYNTSSSSFQKVGAFRFRALADSMDTIHYTAFEMALPDPNNGNNLESAMTLYTTRRVEEFPANPENHANDDHAVALFNYRAGASPAPPLATGSSSNSVHAPSKSAYNPLPVLNASGVEQALEPHSSDTAYSWIPSTYDVAASWAAADPVVYVYGDVTYNAITTSDRRLKTNIRPYRSSLRKLTQLLPVEFQYNDDIRSGSNSVSSETHWGLVAQDVKEVFPRFVSEVAGIMSVNYDELFWEVFSGYQQLKERFDTLKKHLVKEQKRRVKLTEQRALLAKKIELLKGKVEE